MTVRHGVTPCNFACSYQHFREICYRHLNSNWYVYPPNCTASRSKRQRSYVRLSSWSGRIANCIDRRSKIWVMLIKIQPDAAVCRYLFTAKSLYMFRVSQQPSSGLLKTVTATSGTATSLQCVLIRPRWREVAVPVLWPVPVVAVTVFSAPDDGCCDTRNMYSDFAVNKYLHTVESGWISINNELRCTEPWV